MIIGLDSLYKLGLVLNTADGTWYYQSCQEDLFRFSDNDTADFSIGMREEKADIVATLVELSNCQRSQLATFLNSELPHFDKVSGRTQVIQHTIEAMLLPGHDSYSVGDQ
jgi:hypothetical protein